tara:strand:+ start:117 stop:1478 length:1362 start_codon:yes stop_codon:yes gene_type:complete
MRIHFIAIGGTAMHSLAIEMSKKGHIISGSDDIIYEPAKSNLKKAGLFPKKQGWFSNEISSKIDLIILGMHAKKNNVELKKAQSIGLKIKSYPEFINSISSNKTRVVVAGSHGKSTISAMILHVMNFNNIKIDYIIGAPIQGSKETISLTDKNDFIIIEGDEYLSSCIDLRSKFLWYKPHIAIINGISWDHVNVFPSFKLYIDQFKKFILSISEGGVLLYNSLDKNLVDVIHSLNHLIKKIPYKFLTNEINEGVTYVDSLEGKIKLNVFGKHNLINLEGARLACQYMGVNETDFFEAIQSFKGVSGRLELIASGKTSFLYKDFAHAPSKVKATKDAILEQFKNYRIVVCLELHTYSSLDLIFLKNYSNTLNGVDKIIIFYSLKVLKAKNRRVISFPQIKESFNNENIELITKLKELNNNLFNDYYSKTIVLMMSSGNFDGFNYKKFISHLERF